MAQPLPVIINAAAGLGHGAADVDQLGDAFAAAGIPVRLLPAQDGAELSAIAEREARLQPPVIVAGGGDGTLNAVASELVGSQTALGILPMGTLNHFARDSGIPTDLAQAIAVIGAGHVRALDVGEVNGRIFLNNSGVGLYPSLVRHRLKQQHRLGRGKWQAMFWAAMTVLRRSPFLDVSLQLNGEALQCRTPFVFIGNNEYLMEGFRIGERDRLDAGHLSVYYSRRSGRWALLAMALRAVFGGLRRGPHADHDFQSSQARSVLIATRHKRLLVSTDGEIAPVESPLRYRCRAGALRVILPAPQPAA